MAQRPKLMERQNTLGEKAVDLRNKVVDSTFRSAKVPEEEKRLFKYEEEFKQNHAELVSLGVTSEDYFQQKYFEAIVNVFEEIRDAFRRLKGKVDVPVAIEKMPLAPPQQQSLLPIKNAAIEESEAEYLKKMFNRKLEQLNNDLDELHIEVTNQSNKVLEVSKQFLEKRFTDVEEIYKELRNIKSAGSVDEQMEYLETKYIMAIKLITSYQDTPRENILSNTVEPLERRCIAKLENIKIPEFYGDIDEWLSFYDMFKRMVHDNEQIANIEKMYFLKSAIKGDAKTIIRHLQITEENYQIALDMLKQRYQNRRLQFTKQVDILLDQPTVDSESAKSVKQLLDKTNSCIFALKGMGIELTDAEPFIARIIIRKLDKDGLRLYEHSVKKTKEIQQLNDVLEFLEQQYQSLEACTKQQGHKYQKKPNEIHRKYASNLCSTQQICYYCQINGHITSKCRKFKAATITERREFAYKEKLCFKCLNHKIEKKCENSHFKCNICGKAHNSLLHLEDSKSTTKTSMVTKKAATTILLATAQVKVRAASGEYITLRALIDQGSQITTISEEASQILALPRVRNSTEIHGLGGNVVGISKSKVNLIIKPRYLSNNTIKSQALVLSDLTSPQPDNSFNIDLKQWDNYVLADPMFNKSDRIDLVIGADIFSNILEEGVMKKDGVLAQSTKFGWILSGILKTNVPTRKILSAVTNLERFWELEELPATTEECTEDTVCSDLFVNTTEIDAEGKIVVRLPIKEDDELGDSRKQAMARYLSLERKLESNVKLKNDYVKFMREYFQLGHMKLVKKNNSGKYYLPHQPVIRETSLTTKLRVVFDASAKSTNGKSLNDIMYTGPKLQKDIYDILLKWRLWRYVVTADVEKMYRQIKVAENDQTYQYILWRENRNEAIKEYKLTTVTYGTSSAPFLAVKSLFHIADSCQNEDIRNIIKSDFYMDDLMSGADTIYECKHIQVQVSNELSTFGFHLRKWLSNEKSITEDVENSSDNALIQIEDGDSVKTLGLHWDPVMDQFRFLINFVEKDEITKRQALSEVARIFDPLGWLSPVTVVAKLFIQKLWLLQTKWDEILSKDLKDEWLDFTTQLPDLHQIRVPRWILTTKSSLFELHGFADASEKAYAAVIYVKMDSQITLLTAKTKVNPIKNRKTLPKLELCAAHLLAKLFSRVSNTIIRQHATYAWSDSTITLGWINKNNNKDKFVRNRVSEINALAPDANWSHVSSKDNPADTASRGIGAKKFKELSLWWNGPEWLSKSKQYWPKYPDQNVIVSSLTSLPNYNVLNDLVSKMSDINKLQRVVAYVLRFLNKLKGKNNETEYLTVAELDAAEKLIILNHQQNEFKNEISSLKKNQAINSNSKIVGLYPFIDESGILRVGGRLHYSHLHFSQKHPIILQKSHLATIIINNIHTLTLHGGNRLVEATVRRKFWIVGMKVALKKCLRFCTKCIRYRQETAKQIMGILPDMRVTESYPFYHTGVDYAGPIHIRCSKGRGQKSYKGYIAVFVCMSTKAIHLEAVSDLTSEAFIAALRRFFARRGTSGHMYSDNGTNFVGADRKLDADFKAAIKNNTTVIPILAAMKVQWHFIPPAAPHFGGIWEAGVKSMKHHLKRVIGDTKLTFEEMSTLLSQIEAVLNSRPLISVSDNIDSIDALSPGHFLIGRPIIDLPENIENSGITSLDKWKLIQKIRKDFWNRWKEEYLVTLQQRQKWKHPEVNLKEGTIVILKDENTHPTNWPLGRIIEVHEGRDGKIRVVTLKLQNGILKRPIHKVCPLVSADAEEEMTPPVKSYLTAIKHPKRQKSVPLFGFLLLCLLMMKQVKAAPLQHDNKYVSIKDLSPDTALYLDNIGQLNMIDSNWNLVIYYDLSMYQNEIERIHKLMVKVKNECPNLGFYKEACEMVVSTMERRNNILTENNDLLLSKPRKKRAPFEFVGSLYHMLFGMMDADDRDMMEENMRNVFENQVNLKELVKKQTSIVDSTINLLKKTTDDVNSNFNKMYSQLKLFYEEVQNNKNVERLVTLFQVMSTQLNLMIEECSRIQSSIITLLIDINHGHVNPDLLKPAQLHKQLSEIEKLLPNNLVLPGKASGTELKEVYNSMKAKGIIMESRLVIQLEIPLLHEHCAEVYELIKLPVGNNNNTMMSRIENELIIYNFASNMYFLMSQAQLNACEKNLRGQFNCIGNIPWKPAIERSCEVSALKQSRQAECTFEAVPKRSYWKQLSTENQWIFTVFDNFILSVDCGQSNRSWVTLPLKGVLSLSPGCTATYEGVKLTASQRYASKKESSIQTSSWGLEFPQMESKLVKPFDVTIINNTKDINYLRKEVETLRATNIQLKNVQFHTISGHTSLILITIFIIIVLFMYIKSKCCCSKDTVVKLNFSPPQPFRAPQNVQNS